MEKRSGRVRNIIVTDYVEFEDILIRGLTRFGISYVKIGNEFHFLDKIYRFYDTKLHKDLILTNSEFFEENSIVCTPLDMVFLKEKQEFENFFKKFDEEMIIEIKDDYCDEFEEFKMPSKKNIKANNIKVNQKVKRRIFSNRKFNGRRGK